MTLLASTTSIADAFTQLLIGDLPFRFTAYDGSSAGPADAPYGLHLRNERGLSYLLSAPGDLGLARAYVTGDLEVKGAHPGDPFDALMAIKGGATGLKFRMPSPVEALNLVRSLGVSHLIIVSTPDAVLVCDRRDDQAVKKLGSELEKRGLQEWL